jgi:hypothetical protein
MHDRTQDILNNTLGDDYFVYPLVQSTTSGKNIRAIQYALNVKLPREYVAHLRGKEARVMEGRGIYVIAKRAVLSPGESECHMFCHSFHTYSAKRKCPDWMRLMVQGKLFQERTGLNAVPILRVFGDPNLFCVDEKGKLMQYIHDENQLVSIDMNFWELLEYVLLLLEEGKWKIRKETDETEEEKKLKEIGNT